MHTIISIKPLGIIPQNNIDILYKKFNFDFCVIPKVFNADSNPCFKCEAIDKIEIIYNKAVKGCPK